MTIERPTTKPVMWSCRLGEDEFLHLDEMAYTDDTTRTAFVRNLIEERFALFDVVPRDHTAARTASEQRLVELKAEAAVIAMLRRIPPTLHGTIATFIGKRRR